jgi:uncharacterized protein (DUF2164 family)
MPIDKLRKTCATELSDILASELRAMGISLGNLELFPISGILIDKVCSKYYQLGLDDASKVFQKCSEKFEEDMYLLEKTSESDAPSR